MAITCSTKRTATDIRATCLLPLPLLLLLLLGLLLLLSASSSSLLLLLGLLPQCPPCHVVGASQLPLERDADLGLPGAVGAQALWMDGADALAFQVVAWLLGGTTVM
jgi:hypothetical protein